MIPRTTAERFADEMNARAVILEHAFDREHAESLWALLSLRHQDILSRYAVGARGTDAGARIEFVDNTVATLNRLTGRWST